MKTLIELESGYSMVDNRFRRVGRWGWIMLLVGGAALLGWSIAQERWLLLLALSAIPLLLLWPVPAALGAFAFLVPFDMISMLGQQQSDATLTRYVGALSAMVLLVTGLVRRKLERPMVSALWWSLLVFWGAASAAWAIDPNLTIEHIPTTFALLILYVVTTSVHLSQEELSGAVLLTIAGGLAAAVYSSFQYWNGIFYHGGIGGRSSLIIGDRQVDPNIFAASLVLPLSLALGRFLESRGWVRRIFWLCVAGAIGIAVLLTMSRGALLALAVMVFVYFRRLGINRRVLIPVAVMVVILLALPSRFYGRLGNAQATGGAGRLYIWEVGLEAFKHYGLIGAGEQNFPRAYSQYLGAGSRVYSYGNADSHNSYLAVSVELGIVGLGLMCLALRSSLKAARIASNQRQIISTVAFEAACWAMLVSTFFVSMLWRKAFWLPWILLALASRVKKDEQTNRHISA